MGQPTRNERYYRLRAAGLCTYCGQPFADTEQSELKACVACRMKRAQYLRQWREDQKKLQAILHKIALYASKITEPENTETLRREIYGDHKCWKCHWGTWCGDRFFCPIYETCAKERVRFERP